MEEYWKYYSEDYQKVLAGEITTTKPPTMEQPKKSFWETGFGSGLSSLWGFVTSNPQQVVNLVAPKRAVVTDPRDPNYLQNAGFVGGNTPQPQPQQQGNNTTLLVIMGVVIVVILFFMFKKQ